MDTFASFAPRCHYRVIPAALFFVSRDISRAAVQTLFANARINLQHENLGVILRCLPSDALPFLCKVTFTITVA